MPFPFKNIIFYFGQPRYQVMKMAPPLNIYVIYTSEDTEVMLSLGQHLNQLKEFHTISIWQDDPILQGQYWIPKDETRIGETDIFLLLVSDAFMHSEFIHQLEFKMVIDRYKEDKSVVLPIIVDNCPWDIDFRSEDYNFNFNELEVLPSGGKPIAEWKLSDQIFEKIAASVGRVISSLKHDPIQMKSENDSIESPLSSIDEEKVDINLYQEGLAKNNNGQVQGIEEDLKHAEKKHSEEEAEFNEKTRKNPLATEPEVEITVGEANVSKNLLPNDADSKVYGNFLTKNSGLKRRMLLGSVVVLFAIVVTWFFRANGPSSQEERPIYWNSEDTKDEKLIDVNDSVVIEKIEISPSLDEKSLSELVVGDPYDGGIVFSIDSDGKSGKVAHRQDAGPMPWKKAMNIHLQLGEGWRLPTLDELKLMRRTIGQGASNSGQFAQGLYWSATLYDDYQAQLLRFSDGNASYHYNMENEERSFMVRAVRDFSR